MSKISENYAMYEVVRSQEAKENNIDNSLPVDLIPNITRFCDKVLEFYRKVKNKPVSPSSWFRSPKLNDFIHGTKGSRHMLGLAIDDPDFKDKEAMVEFYEKLLYLDSVTGHKAPVYEVYACHDSKTKKVWIHIAFAIRGEKLYHESGRFGYRSY